MDTGKGQHDPDADGVGEMLLNADPAEDSPACANSTMRKSMAVMNGHALMRWRGVVRRAISHGIVPLE